MGAPYIPPKNVDFVAWADNFRDYIDINFAALFLGAGDVAAIDTAVNDWDAAFALIANPATKTKVTVAAAATQRATTEMVCRLYASAINANPAITNGQRAALGITIRDTMKTPILPPVSYPILTLNQALPGSHQLAYKDQLIVNGKAKAFGGRFVEVRCAVGTVPPVNEDVVPTKAYVTKSPFLLIYTILEAAKTAYYFARYISPRGEPGPWAPVVPIGII
jgi:hypothetical protein